MSDVSALALTATTGAELKRSGEEADLKAWLTDARPEMSRENRRQICHHVRKLLDILGSDVRAKIGEDLDAIEAQIAKLDLNAYGLDPNRRSHLGRAARTLHAAVKGLSTENARAAMDRKHGGTARKTAAGPAKDAANANREEGAVPTAGTEEGESGITVYQERPDGTITPLEAFSLTEAEMPLAFRFLETAIANHVSLDLDVGSADPDIMATAREVLAAHSPAVRMGIASRLPGIESVRVLSAQGTQASPLDLCDEIILAFVQARGVALLDKPAAAA